MTDTRMEIEKLTNEELDSLIIFINQEKRNREKEKREKLIDEFKKAWENLVHNGIDILWDEEALHWDELTFD